jgi:phospholipid/cholesterol/gamma-HCH transport system substrate-binding protein
VTLGRKLIAAAVIGLLLGTLIAAAGGGDGDGSAYRVRAVFDNASFVIPGEDVKIAGVKVGQIDDVDLTDDNKAVVVLRIDDPAFTPFRRDAHCQIRLQSLIGEQYIECEPTGVRKEGKPLPAALPKVDSGDGKGQYLLTLSHTTTPIAVDLINNITRLPQQQRFRLIVNELGAGLAGNGPALRAAVRRANPALREFDEFVRILADQNEQLARLNDESDAVLEPWAKRREQVAGFIDQAGLTAAATAERGDDLERNFERLPQFLRQQPAWAASFSSFADQFTPALQELQRNAPQVNQTIKQLGPFLTAATPAVQSLGDFADRGREIFPAIRPLVQNVQDLSGPLKPTSTQLAKALGSFDDAGGVEELMRFIFFYAGATNGEDQLGHYLRGDARIGQCAQRDGRLEESCTATPERIKANLFGDGKAQAQDAMLDYLLAPQEGGR